MYIGARTGAFAALGVALAGALACGSGSGTNVLGEPSGGYEPPVGTYEKPGTTYENPNGSSQSSVTSSGLSGTSSGGYQGTSSSSTSSSSGSSTSSTSTSSSGNGGGTLPLSPCSGSYTCDGSIAATLSNSGGVCSLTIATDVYVIQPDGTVTVSGSTIGTWTGTSAAFDIEASSDAGTAAVTCVQ